MEIEVANEVIEKIVEKEAKKYVDSWFKKNRFIVEQCTKQVIHEYIVQNGEIESLIKRIGSKQIADEVVAGIGKNIADHFFEDYGY